jgi:hypothetical protein
VRASTYHQPVSEQQPDAGPPAPYDAPQPPATFAPPQYSPAPPYGGYGPPPQGAPQYGPAPYGSYGQPAGYGTPPYGGYPQPTPTSGWTIALVVVSGFCVFTGLIGVPSLVLGIIALTKARTDPAEARRLTWIGWLVLGILVALLVVFLVVVVAIAVSSSSGDDGTTIGTLGTTLRPLALRST